MPDSNHTTNECKRRVATALRRAEAGDLRPGEADVFAGAALLAALEETEASGAPGLRLVCVAAACQDPGDPTG